MLYYIIGQGRHGKDTLAEAMRDTLGLKFCNSSYFCCNLFIFDELKEELGYSTVEECFEDRANHRKRWHDLISDYNKHDPTRLAKNIFHENDIYVGNRSSRELLAGQEEFNCLTIWVDASDRLPPESTDSCKVTKEMADIIIDNNGTEKEFQKRVFNFCKILPKTFKLDEFLQIN